MTKPKIDRQLFVMIVLSTFFGAVAWQQFILFQYFYQSKWDDVVLLTVITITSLFIAAKYRRVFISSQPVVVFVTLCLGSSIYELSYHLFQTVDILWVSTYLFCMIGAICLSITYKNGIAPPYRSSLVFILLLFSFLGGIVTHFSLIYFQFVVWFLVILYFIIDLWSVRPPYWKWARAVLVIIVLLKVDRAIPSPQLYPSQRSYYDKVVFSKHTPFQQVDVTSWKGEQWYYYNGINSFSSIDYWLYYEPLVHPIMHLAEHRKNVLVIGGENGMAINALLQYQEVDRIDHFVIDKELRIIAKYNDWFTALNEQSLSNPKVTIKNGSIFRHLNTSAPSYDIIIVDLPDPVDLETNQYYTSEFYNLCYKSLSNHGLMVTQAGSPYFATQAYHCIAHTMQSVQFDIVKFHNQVLTLGEWGWVIGSKVHTDGALKSRLSKLSFDQVATRWINREAMNMMLSFGKTTVDTNESIINTLKEPVAHIFYTQGTWEFDSFNHHSF